MEIPQKSKSVKSKSVKASVPDLATRLSLLGVPPSEVSEAVQLGFSVLFERLDDATLALERAKQHAQELEKLVDVDCIAPIPNRRAFMRRLEWALSMHARYGHPCAIVYFDLNGFKHINDTYGHAAGDKAIRHVSKLLGGALRETDYLARLSGDEFAIILYYAQAEAAIERGRQLSALLAANPLPWKGKFIKLSAAYGAHAIAKGDDAEEALARADAAMYLDKKKQRAPVTDADA